MKLAGRIAIVTGGASGIGHATSKLFGQEGATVVVADRDTDAAERVAAELREAGGTAVAMAVDVTNDAAALRKTLQDRQPMGRMGQPIEIAKAILFLASDDASFCTGTVLMADGGWTAR